MAKKEEQSAFLVLVDKIIDRGTDYEMDMEDVAAGLLDRIFKARGRVKLDLGGFREPKKVKVLPKWGKTGIDWDFKLFKKPQRGKG
mgnify:CR=1 FL=1